MKSVIDYLNKHKSHAPMLVRLVTHRIEFFEKLEPLPENHAIGQCWFGPSGSAAGYWVTRSAAKILSDKLRPGFLPFDIAIERAWETNVANYVINPSVCALRSSSSTIGETASSQHKKPLWYKRLGAAQFRTRAFFVRIIWCLKNRKIVN
jgi:glycosyl transferase, family 25